MVNVGWKFVVVPCSCQRVSNLEKTEVVLDSVKGYMGSGRMGFQEKKKSK